MAPSSPSIYQLVGRPDLRLLVRVQPYQRGDSCAEPVLERAQGSRKAPGEPGAFLAWSVFSNSRAPRSKPPAKRENRHWYSLKS